MVASDWMVLKFYKSGLTPVLWYIIDPPIRNSNRMARFEKVWKSVKKCKIYFCTNLIVRLSKKQFNPFQLHHFHHLTLPIENHNRNRHIGNRFGLLFLFVRAKKIIFQNFISFRVIKPIIFGIFHRIEMDRYSTKWVLSNNAKISSQFVKWIKIIKK